MGDKNNMPRSGDVMVYKKAPLWDRLGSSMLRFRCSTSQTRSRLAILRLASCAAAARVRYLQELRGLVSRGFHGRQWRGHAWQGDLLRAQGGGRCGRQEEVSRCTELLWIRLAPCLSGRR